MDLGLKFRNIFCLAIIISLMSACSFMGKSSHSKKTEAVSDIGKKELSKEVRERLKRSEKYTKNNKLLSVLNEDGVRERCRFNPQKDWQNWSRMLRIGFKCVMKNNWKVVRQIGMTFSKKHIDAPWGPYFMSLVSEKKRDMPRAIWMIGLADRKSPNNAIIEFQKARLLWLQSQRDASFHAAKKALSLNPNLTEAELLIGQIYFNDYEFEKAEKHFKKVLKKNSRVFTATLGLAESLVQLGKVKEAIPYFVKSIKLERNRIDLAYRLADVFENEVKNYKKSLVWYKKISQTFPQELISREKMRVLNKIKELNEKIKVLKAPKKKKVLAKESSKSDRKAAAQNENIENQPQNSKQKGQGQ